MKIGYSVEGSTDRAIIKGLSNRWCPNAELLEGKFRGQSRTSRHREIPKICQELSIKQADLIVFLTDSNVNNWREVQKGDAEKCPPQYRHRSIFGVCLRNSECWLAADSGYIAKRFGRNVESSFGITGTEKQEAAIAEFVRTASLHRWRSTHLLRTFTINFGKKAKNEVAKSRTCASHKGP